MPLAAFTRHGQDTTGLEAMKDLAMARYTALPAPMRAAMGPRTRESLQTIVTPSLWMGLANEESVRMMKFMQELERRAGL